MPESPPPSPSPAPPPPDYGTCAISFTPDSMCRSRDRVQVWDDAWHDLTSAEQEDLCLQACAQVAKSQPDVSTCCGGNFDANPWCFAYKADRTMHGGSTFKTSMCPPAGAAQRALAARGGARLLSLEP